MTTKPTSETEIFQTAANLPAEERGPFLDRACGDNQPLRREIESLLSHVGADIEQLSGARIRVKLNGAEGILHRPHHGGNTLDRSSVQHLRELLAEAMTFAPAIFAHWIA